MRPGRIGFTTRASSMLAAGLTAVVCGALLGETDLLRAGVLAAAIPVVAAVVIHRYRIRIANRRTVEPHRAAAGESVTVHLTITNRSALPTGPLMLEDGLPDLAVGHARFVLDSLARHEARTGLLPAARPRPRSVPDRAASHPAARPVQDGRDHPVVHRHGRVPGDARRRGPDGR